MSKNEVLEQVYPDEINYIFDIARAKELEKLEQHITQMYTFATGDGPKQWFEKIVDQYNYLIGQQKRDADPEKQETTEDAFEKLKKMQELIAQTQQRKKGPRGGGAP